jgi:hypothetical protein
MAASDSNCVFRAESNRGGELDTTAQACTAIVLMLDKNRRANAKFRLPQPEASQFVVRGIVAAKNGP